LFEREVNKWPHIWQNNNIEEELKKEREREKILVQTATQNLGMKKK
jgi:hypothetical protein